MKNRFLSKLLLIVLLTTILSSCASTQPATVRPKTPLRVEYTEWWGDYTILVAQEKGFFEQYGVQVEPVYYGVYKELYPDLAAGQIDGALIAMGDVININHMTPMKVVGVDDDGGADSIVVGPEINSIRDLQNKTVGVLVGTQYEMMIAEMLRSANMDTGDVIIVDIDPENALEALQSGQVQAVYTWEPHLSETLANGYKALFPTQHLRLFPDVIVFNKSIVDNRPDEVRGFLKAWFQALEYRLQHEGETREIAAKYLGTTAEKIKPDPNVRLYNAEDNRKLFDAQEENSIYQVAKLTSNYLVSIGTTTRLVDPLELLDPSFLP